jgi:hypothetical protein
MFVRGCLLPGVLRVNEREEKKRSVEEVEMC